MRAFRSLIGVTASAVISRIAVLITLVAYGHTVPLAEYQNILLIVAIAVTLQVMFDTSSLGTFIIQKSDSGSRLEDFFSGKKISFIAGIVTVCVCSFVGMVMNAGGDVVIAAFGLGVLAASESVTRYSRWVWQVKSEFAQYAVVDWALSVNRIIYSSLVFFAGSVAWATSVVVMTSATIVSAAVIAAQRCVLRDSGPTAGRASLFEFARAATPFVLGVSLSAAYSQLPTLMLGLRSDVASGATFAAATRITQPTEIAPAALANVALPKLVGRNRGRSRIVMAQLSAAIAIALVCAASIYLAVPVISQVLNYPESLIYPVIGVLVLALPIKFVNYQLVVLAIATGLIKARVIATALIAVLTLVATWIVAPLGPVQVAVVVLCAEALLCAILCGSIMRMKRLQKRELGIDENPTLLSRT
ncbi:oligosaccharide flippase family protein [Rhodococcus hoagii]|uniref:Polysaccharide biosynthesis protein n=1 Tax=Prescottella equi ATCC 33707 TaxID=525370 RepID=E9SX28_RHOHA|nr:oligosaccharide flippase family protein [Prescottella equi]EGD25708.1 polysaccharide biosynthesis protein [Prescottella equi ATCC 33707]NKV29029.1 oligosaccharide flippase family protein [Prescottella equi]